MNSFKWGMAIVMAALSCALAFAAKKSVVQSANLDLAFIINTGSTNTTSYQVDVFSNGSCGIENSFTRALLSKINAQYHKSGHLNAFEKSKIPMSVAQKFFRDIKAAQPLSQLPVNHTIKSISFGTSIYVGYNGQQTPDLSSPADVHGQALAADVRNIIAALDLKDLPRRPIGPLTPPSVGH